MLLLGVALAMDGGRNSAVRSTSHVAAVVAMLGPMRIIDSSIDVSSSMTRVMVITAGQVEHDVAEDA